MKTTVLVDKRKRVNKVHTDTFNFLTPDSTGSFHLCIIKPDKTSSVSNTVVPNIKQSSISEENLIQSSHDSKSNEKVSEALTSHENVDNLPTVIQ